MKVTREQAEANRQKVVDAASALFRKHGFDGVGVVDIMKAAGLTHGGFYGHFDSKVTMDSNPESLRYQVLPYTGSAAP